MKRVSRVVTTAAWAMAVMLSMTIPATNSWADAAADLQKCQTALGLAHTLYGKIQAQLTATQATLLTTQSTLAQCHTTFAACKNSATALQNSLDTCKQQVADSQKPSGGLTIEENWNGKIGDNIEVHKKIDHDASAVATQAYDKQVLVDVVQVNGNLYYTPEKSVSGMGLCPESYVPLFLTVYQATVNPSTAKAKMRTFGYQQIPAKPSADLDPEAGLAHYYILASANLLLHSIDEIGTLLTASGGGSSYLNSDGKYSFGFSLTFKNTTLSPQQIEQWFKDNLHTYLYAMCKPAPPPTP